MLVSPVGSAAAVSAAQFSNAHSPMLVAAPWNVTVSSAAQRLNAYAPISAPSETSIRFSPVQPLNAYAPISAGRVSRVSSVRLTHSRNALPSMRVTPPSVTLSSLPHW